MRVYLLASLLMLPAAVPAQTAAKVDFEQDIQPIFRQNCYGCHGPAQQHSGLRLDRKSSALKPGARRIVPGSTENSFLLLRLKSGAFGPQMPPTGPLKPDQIELIGKWIDQGADWPDRLSNETAPPPLNPKAVSMVEALRTGDRAGFERLLAEDRTLLNARGPEGSSPFQYAVIYASAKQLAALIEMGADVNHANDAKATPLMWAVDNLEKTQLLLKAGAGVNALSEDHRTPLMIAAGRPGNLAAVKLLLDKGAKTDPNARPSAESSPLIEAAQIADAAVMEVLIAHGANVKASAGPALSLAVAMECGKCVEVLLATKAIDKAAANQAMGEAGYLADPKTLDALVHLGADLNAPDPFGRTPLIYLANRDVPRLDAVKFFVEHGADINFQIHHPKAVDDGWTVLDVARHRGQTSVVAYLEKLGAKASETGEKPNAATKHGNNVASAIQASLPLLQKADANFTPKAGCISCHNQSFAALTVSAARKSGFRVEESLATQQRMVNAGAIQGLREPLHQGFLQAVEGFFAPFVVANLMMGLHAEGYPADLSTDAAARFLKNTQQPDGHWPYVVSDGRPPICADHVSQTAIAMRALQLYPVPAEKAAYQTAVNQAAMWLAGVRPLQNEDRVFRVLGLAWAGTQKEALASAMKDLVAAQKPDGGWSDIPTMPTNAYATGNSLVALRTAGMPATDPVFQKGIQYLLETQRSDGSWFVKSAALAIQPYFDAGFPHAYDQFISAAGTSWATLALTMAEKAQVAGLGN